LNTTTYKKVSQGGYKVLHSILKADITTEHKGETVHCAKTIAAGVTIAKDILNDVETVPLSHIAYRQTPLSTIYNRAIKFLAMVADIENPEKAIIGLKAKAARYLVAHSSDKVLSNKVGDLTNRSSKNKVPKTNVPPKVFTTASKKTKPVKISAA